MIQWVAFAVSVVGILLNAKKNMLCWPVWIGSNILWIIHIVTSPEIDYAALCLWIVFLSSNIYGWRQWRKSTVDKGDMEPIGWQSDRD